MRSSLFDQQHAEVSTGQRFTLQSSRMLRVVLGPDLLALKGSMVAYQGRVAFHHEGAGSVGKLVKRMLTSEDTPLMRVSGQGEVFFAQRAQNVFLVGLEGDRDQRQRHEPAGLRRGPAVGRAPRQRRGRRHGRAVQHRDRRPGDGGADLRRRADAARLLPAADLRRRAGGRRVVGEPGAAGGLEHERALAAAGWYRGGAAVRLPRRGFRGGAALGGDAGRHPAGQRLGVRVRERSGGARSVARSPTGDADLRPCQEIPRWDWSAGRGVPVTPAAAGPSA